MPKLKKLLEALATVFMMFKFTPRLFDIISEMIRGTHEQIRTAEREVMRYAVRRGRMDRTQFRTSFPGQESNFSLVRRANCQSTCRPKRLFGKSTSRYFGVPTKNCRH